jgi:glutathione S-transferase
MPQVDLYGLSRSVYTRIARLVLEEKGVPYTLHEVEIFGPEGVPQAHRARQPFGRIPALEHDGFAFAGPSRPPAGPARRARMNQIISVLDAYAYRPMVWDVFVERIGQPLRGRTADEVKIVAGLAASRQSLDALATLVDGAPFLVGGELSLADLHAHPMLCMLALAPEGRALLNEYDGLRRWFEAMQARSSVRRTRTRYELQSPLADHP